MTYARKRLVCLNDTPYYYVIARCVRRAWLWGFDEYAGTESILDSRHGPSEAAVRLMIPQAR
jgi:hypothetical protein